MAKWWSKVVLFFILQSLGSQFFFFKNIYPFHSKSLVYLRHLDENVPRHLIRSRLIIYRLLYFTKEHRRMPCQTLLCSTVFVVFFFKKPNVLSFFRFYNFPHLINYLANQTCQILPVLKATRNVTHLQTVTIYPSS